MELTRDKKRCNDTNMVPNTGTVLHDSDLLSHIFSQQCPEIGKAGLIPFQEELKELKAIGPENGKA